MLAIVASALLAAPSLQPVSFPSGTEKASGLLALPGRSGKHPALILVHEWWGLNDFAKNKAKQLAEQGARAGGLSVDFKEYAGAGHGFASSADPKVFRPEQAAEADRRARDFLAASLMKR